MDAAVPPVHKSPVQSLTSVVVDVGPGWRSEWRLGQ